MKRLLIEHVPDSLPEDSATASWFPACLMGRPLTD